MNDKIKLNNVKVVFANMKDEGFGRSITIDATNPETQKTINEWVKDNNIGKADNAGKANFKEYEPEVGDKVIQYSFKINDYTKIVGVNGLVSDDLGYGAVVSIMAQAFQYDNKFGKGTSASLTAVLITASVRTSSDDDVDELLSEAGIEKVEEVFPGATEDTSGVTSEEDKAREKWGKKTDDAPLPEPQGEINLDDIPF
ncbi:hypothetical protein H0W80_00145 [Candidatus Saccharibacteria bacterium]|nr:hypothetical protein [Candidatus Saccharibacteria bacterium]